MALRTMPIFIKDEPAYSLTIQTTLLKDDRTIYSLVATSEKQIYTYEVAVHILLKFYATDFNTPRATLDIALMRKTSIKASVHFPNVLQLRIVRCGNAYPAERI